MQLTLSHMVSIFFVADAMYDPIDPVASIICVYRYVSCMTASSILFRRTKTRSRAFSCGVSAVQSAKSVVALVFASSIGSADD